MKVALFLGGFLIITFGGYSVSGNQYWQNKMQDALNRMKAQLEAEGEVFEKEMEATGKKIETEAKKFEAEVKEIRQKCAKKGYPNAIDGHPEHTVLYNESIDGFRHIYMQSYNSTTKKLSGSYYRINEKDPKTEPICGKLQTE